MEWLTRGHVIVVCLVVSCIVKENESSPNQESDNQQNKEKFINLLTSIADVNKKRLDVLKVYGQLADYNIHSRALRSKNEKKDNVVGIVLLNPNDINNENAHGLYNVGNFTEFDLNNPGAYDEESEDDVGTHALLNAINNMEKEDDDPIKLVDVLKGMTSKSHHNDESLKLIKMITAVTNKNADTKRATYFIQDEMESEESEDNGREFSYDDMEANALRYSSCRRRALRQCKKVCRATAIRVCSRYRCSRDVKQSIRNSCGGFCRKAFNFY